MVDIRPYQSRLQKTKTYENSENPRSDFLSHLSDMGFTPPKILRDGIIDRISDPTDKGIKQSGWYIFNQYENIAIASFGTWKDGEKHTWTSKSQNSLNFAERVRLNETIKENELKYKEEVRQKNEEAAIEASQEYKELDDVKENPYLIKKGVKPCAGLKQKGEILYMPILDDGVIQSYQRIYPDGTKKLKLGGRKKGCYFIIDGAENNIFISEGLSTGLSVHEATGAMVYVAIDCGNLYEVAQKVKENHRDAVITIAGENNDANRTKCNQIDLPVISPPHEKYDDFNDMHVALGIDAVTQILKPTTKPTKSTPTKKQIKGKSFRFGGVMDEIIDYYNATSGNDQPLFAIQTAIATCSIILGRHFITNYGNKSALYMLNLAKSATGKEHAKKTIEKILEETDNGHLIGGDGYTSGSAVLSALQYRPRHITIIDEFSKSLEMANNKNSNGQLKEANHKLMEVIGRLDSTIRPRAYSMVGMTQSKMKEMSEQKIISPHITLLAMSTPSDFFKNITQDAIKDGFINRFVVCISSTPRTVRQQMNKMDVPQSIINWDLKIKDVTGNPDDFAEQQPNEKVVSFTLEAFAEQEKFQRKCIDLANELEIFGMEELTGRSNEMAMRLALIIALSNNPNTDKIQKEDMQKAIEWIDYNLQVIVDKLKMTVSGSEFEANKKEVLQAIRDNAITWSNMQKRPPYSKYKPKDLKEILQSLQDSGLVDGLPEEKTGKGRPSVLWTAT